MPGILDLVEDARNRRRGNDAAIQSEYKTAMKRAREIRARPDDDQKALHKDLLPDFDSIRKDDNDANAKTLARIREWNEKARVAIDDKLGLS